MISTVTYMAINYTSRFMAQLNPFDMGVTTERESLEPIQYTSMFWWLAMNYALLLALMSLPLLVIKVLL